MAQTTNLPIYKVAYDLLDVVTDLVKNMPRDFKQSIGGKISQECVEMAKAEFGDYIEFSAIRQLEIREPS